MDRSASVGRSRKLFHLIQTTAKMALNVNETICTSVCLSTVGNHVFYAVQRASGNIINSSHSDSGTRTVDCFNIAT